MKLQLTLLFVFLISISAFSQTETGKVRVSVEPKDARISLNDSILENNRVYNFPQGIYDLSIQKEGFETYRNRYFQVFKSKNNFFSHKMRKERPDRLLKAIEIASPAFSTPIAYLLANTIFPVKSLSDASNKVAIREANVIDAKNELERDYWANDIELNSDQYNSSLQKYQEAVDEYNNQVQKNNRNRILVPAITSAAAIANFYYIYKKYKQRKKKRKEIGINVSTNQVSLSINF